MAQAGQVENAGQAAEQAYQELAERSSEVVVAGLSMGGSLACHLAAAHAVDLLDEMLDGFEE